jgi:hypothetical protein
MSKKKKNQSLVKRLQTGLNLVCASLLAADQLLTLVEALAKACH